MTAARSASSLEVPMSWVMRIKLVEVSCLTRFNTFMMLAWVSTSSAEVGSSRMIRSGSVTMAMAMATRWRMPPLSSKA